MRTWPAAGLRSRSKASGRTVECLANRERRISHWLSSPPSGRSDRRQTILLLRRSQAPHTPPRSRSALDAARRTRSKFDNPVVATYPPALVPTYTTPSASQPTALWAGRVDLATGGSRMPGTGEISLSWRPGPWIRFEQQPSRLVPAVLNTGGGRLVSWGLAASAEYVSTGTPISLGTVRTTGFLPAGLEVRRSSRTLAVLDFHLVNFPTYVGDPVSVGGGWRRARISFQGHGWVVDLDWVADASRLEGELRADRGYAITHVGRLARKDGSPFTAARGMRFVDSLLLLFGFVGGAWAGPTLKLLWRQGVKSPPAGNRRRGPRRRAGPGGA